MADGDVTAGLVAEVRKRIGTAATLGFSDALLHVWLTRAQHDLLWRLHESAIIEHTATATGALVASRFSLPTDFLREHHVTVDGKRARRWSVTELRNLGTSLATGSPSAPWYYLWHDGASVIGVVDVDNLASTLPYALYYVKQPPILGASTDPTMGEGLHDLLVQYVVAMCREQRREYEEQVRLLAWYGWRITQVNSRYLPGRLSEGIAGDPIERTLRTTKGGRPSARR